MTHANHTPGPWKAHKTPLARSGVPEFEIHWSDIGECVAEIVHGEPDARLIAAAPDLLDACKALLEVTGALMHGEKCDHSVGICFCGTFHAMDEARAAISRATGEKP